jgi:hypothetical protein
MPSAPWMSKANGPRRLHSVLFFSPSCFGPFSEPLSWLSGIGSPPASGKDVLCEPETTDDTEAATAAEVIVLGGGTVPTPSMPKRSVSKTVSMVSFDTCDVHIDCFTQR